MGVVTSRAVPSVARVRSAAFCAICSSVGESLIVCCRATMGDTMSSGADGGGSANRFSRSIAFGCAATLPSVSAMPGSAPVGTPKLDPTTLSVVGAALSSGTTPGPVAKRIAPPTVPPPTAPTAAAICKRDTASSSVMSWRRMPMSTRMFTPSVAPSVMPSTAPVRRTVPRRLPPSFAENTRLDRASIAPSAAPTTTAAPSAWSWLRPSFRASAYLGPPALAAK